MTSRVLYSDGGVSLVINESEDIHILPLTLPLPPEMTDISELSLDTSNTAHAAETDATELVDMTFFPVSLVEQIELSSSVDILEFVHDGMYFIHLPILCSIPHAISCIIVISSSTTILR